MFPHCFSLLSVSPTISQPSFLYFHATSENYIHLYLSFNCFFRSTFSPYLHTLHLYKCTLAHKSCLSFCFYLSRAILFTLFLCLTPPQIRSAKISHCLALSASSCVDSAVSPTLSHCLPCSHCVPSSPHNTKPHHRFSPVK